MHGIKSYTLEYYRQRGVIMVKNRLVDAIEDKDSKSKIWKTSFVAARLAYEEGKFREAYRQLMKTLKRAEGMKQEEFAKACTHMGMAAVLTQLGKFKEAKSYFDKAMAVSGRKDSAATKELHAVTLMFYADMIMEEKGDLNLAEASLLESVEILEELGTEYALFLANSLLDLSGLYLQMEKYDEAESYIQAALPLLATVYGRADETYLRASAIHQICQHKDDEDFIFELVKEDTTRMMYQVGTKHPNLTRALRRYAQHLKEHGQSEKLEELHNRFEKVFK